MGVRRVMTKRGFMKLIAWWIGALTLRKTLKIMKVESSVITIVSKKCAALVHIKTPNGKSIKMPTGGIVVIIRLVSASSKLKWSTPTTIEPNTQIDASRRSKLFYPWFPTYTWSGAGILRKKKINKGAPLRIRLAGAIDACSSKCSILCFVLEPAKQ